MLQRILLSSLLLTLTIASCKSLGTEEDQAQAGSLWDRIQGYDSWSYFDGHEGFEKSKGVHGPIVRVFLNDLGAADQANPPSGTIVVKENLRKRDADTLISLTVMERIEGYDPENADWFYARYTPEGELTHSGKVASCIDCHFDGGDDDYLFYND